MVAFKTCVVCDKTMETSSLREHQEIHMEAGGIHVSSDPKDMVVTRCCLCGCAFTLGGLRGHTRRQHGLAVSEYKATYGARLEARVYHRCGICGELVLHDSDSISAHLHNHPSHTHKEYNQEFMTKGLAPGRAPKQRPGAKADLLAEAVSSLDFSSTPSSSSSTPSSSSSPFLAPGLEGRTSRQWLSHEEMHLSSWPHEECGEEQGVEMLVLDTQGLTVTVA